MDNYNAYIHTEFGVEICSSNNRQYIEDNIISIPDLVVTIIES